MKRDLSPYENLLAEMARDHSGMFWQYNFLAGVGAAALIWEVLRLTFPGAPTWARLTWYVVPALLEAWYFQRKYRRRAARAASDPQS